MNKGFWMAKGPGCLTDGEMTYDNSSRIEPKRSHQWFMEGTEAELFPNKKQAVEVSGHNSFSGLLNSNVSPWGNASSFHSVAGQYNERLFDPETARTINFDDRNIPSVGTGNINMGRKVIEDPFGNDSSFGLSISHTLEDPRSGINYGGIRKVKVSQVKDSENFMSMSMGQAYTRGDNNNMSMPHAYSKTDDSSISMGLSFNRGDDNIILMGDTYNRDNNNFISMGQPYNKGDESNVLMGHTYKENNNGISMGQSFSKDDDNITTIGQTFNKGDDNTISMSDTFKENNNAMSMSQSFSKGDNNITTMGQTFNKGDDNTISMGHFFKENSNGIPMGQSFSKGDNNITAMGQTFNKEDDNTISMGHSYNKVDDNTITMGRTYSKVNNNNVSVGHSFSKGESNIISFGGFHDDEDINSSGRLICSYDLLMGQSSAQRSEALNEKGLVESNSDALVSAAQMTASGVETVSKKKEEQKGSKKVPPNNFPSNVRSLLSTGMLDGVPVKYIAWSREKELRGIIKGSGYLCGCQSCNFSKAINAYEFERHAGCKTKHPNNHIYFENGKTIYGIVQELRNTPQNLLFEVIQTITGSPINQKSFRLWKESFLAATRELQRIYGKDEGKQLS
uniref:Tify domain-containing protein n=1 Tax=Davidia involucrata TaxID=16924 RepID=A0A5B7BI22_DAVIN